LVVSNRRGFFAGAAAAVCFASDAASWVLRAEEIAGGSRGDDMAAAEDYWAEIRRAFDSDQTLINLNHGGVAPAPAAVLDAMLPGGSLVLLLLTRPLPMPMPIPMLMKGGILGGIDHRLASTAPGDEMAGSHTRSRPLSQHASSSNPPRHDHHQVHGVHPESESAESLDTVTETPS